MRSYQIKRKLGEGSYGMVFEAINNDTKSQVAIKRSIKGNEYESKEIQIMKEMNNSKHTIKMLDYFYTIQLNGNIIQNIVMELGQQSLQDLLEQKQFKDEYFQKDELQWIIYDILSGLAELHEKNIVHRDLKCDNILLVNDCWKIIDFGQAKKLDNNINCNNCLVVIPSYRAPELLLGVCKYTTAIDIWVIGCIFAQLLILDEFFQDQKQNNQLLTIINKLGSFSEDEMSYYQDHMTQNNEILKNIPKINKKPLSTYFSQNIDKNCLQLLSSMLQYHPDKRIQAKEALKHKYFQKIQ